MRPLGQGHLQVSERLGGDLAPITFATFGPAVDFVELAIEESPVNESNVGSVVAPFRTSTVKTYPPARTARLAPAPQHLSRADELRGIRGEVPRLIDGYEPAGVLTSRAYADLLTFLLPLAGWVGTWTAGGAAVTDPATTTVQGANGLNSAIINVVDAGPLDPSGTVIINGLAVTYTGKTATSLTGAGAHAAYAGGESVVGNVPVGANRWVFLKRDAIDARSAKLRINYATENVLMEGYGFGISSLQLPASGEMSADLMGLYLRRLAADTGTVPSIPASVIPPFRRAELYVSALAGGGRLSDFTIGIANALERIKSMSQPTVSDWPDALEYGDDEVQVSGTIPKRILTGADIDALIAATTFSMTARWQARKVIGATTKPYGLWFEMPKVQYTGGEPDEMGGNKRRFGFNPDWFAMYDETAGYDAKITLVNGVTATETYV